MHFLSLAALLLLPSQLVSGQQSMEDICDAATGVDGCKGAIKVPASASLKMCEKNVPEIDPCKTKKAYRYPCPTWSNPTKMCDGELCVPGTITTVKKIPCGINIVTKSISTCQAIRDTLGNAGNIFIKSADALCNCLPRIMKLGVSGAIDTVFSATGPLTMESSFVAEVVRLQNCFLTQAFNIKDNSKEVYANELASKDGWIVFHSAEITLSTYEELALAVSPCLTGVACNPVLIGAFFKRYAKDSAVTLGFQIAKLLTGWLNNFKSMKTRLATISRSAQILTTNVALMNNKMKANKKKICTGELCDAPGISTFFQKIAKAMTALQYLQSFQKAVANAADSVPEMIDRVEQTIQATKFVPDSDFFVDLVQSGAFSKVEDILDSISIAKEFPKSVAELEDMISDVQVLPSKFTALGDAATAAVKDVVSFSWDKYKKELNADPSGKLRSGLTDIQNTFRTQLNIELASLAVGLKGLKDDLAAVPIKKGMSNFQPGLASYDRWSYVTVDAPCAKTSHRNFELGGFKKTFDYPSFYSCEYGPQEITWPSHFVPYMKFKLS